MGNSADESSGSQSLVRRENIYSGNVQGVGFRYTVSRIAENYAVTGFVKNLPDGRVQLVADGSKQETELFVAAVSEAMADNIASIESSAQACTPSMQAEYKQFSIQH
jgi:acylphosphatase